MSEHPHRNASSYPRQTDDQSDLTWLDFIRNATVTVQPERSDRTAYPPRTDSADRKRRHTGSDAGRRTYRYPTYNGRPSDVQGIIPQRSSGTIAGRSRDTAIDLTSPARSVTRPGPQRMSGSDGNVGDDAGIGRLRRRESDFVLPRWQSDHEVSKCPVCETEFSSLYRRHHCRKCGRVVCARCSPHRITIPRQYIVQPPTSSLADDATAASTTPLRNPALGGGEVVRVCNPCVPDPWTPDAATIADPTTINTTTTRPHSSAARISHPHNHQQPHIGNAMASDRPDNNPFPRSRPERYRSVEGGISRMRSVLTNFADDHDPRNSHSRSRESQSAAQADDARPGGTTAQQHQIANQNTIQPGDDRLLSLLNYDNEGYAEFMATRQTVTGPNGQTIAAGQDPYDRTLRFATSAGAVPNMNFEPYPGGFQRFPGHRRATSAFTRPSAPPPPAPAPPAARPRRQIAEEDECPVCGNEMAPGDTIREQHIIDCINARAAPHSATPPVTSNAAPATATANAIAAEGSRQRATSFRPRGIAKRAATEKDCVDASGEQRECTICLEEFQPADELGILECFCVFHRACIRGWFDTKGEGHCPTHSSNVG